MIDESLACGLLDVAMEEARRHGVRDVEMHLHGSREALTRFANNAIHQNVAEVRRDVSVRVLADHRTARATANRLSEETVRAAVREAIAIMRAQPPDEHLLPLASPDDYLDVPRYAESTASCTPAQRASAVSEAIRIVEAAGQTAAGIYSTAHSASAILNSNGVFGLHEETLAVFSITALASDSSGWAKQSAVDRGQIDSSALARRASEKAALSASPREIAPGRFTVILEPAAVLDLVGQIFPDFSGTAIEDRRSFLTGRLDKALFGENITIWDDYSHPLQCGEPFDGEGVPRTRLLLVESGVPREVAWSRAAAHRNGRAPTGHGFPLPNEIGEMPVNIVIQGGETSLEQMIASTTRGILVTRFWYIREVDPFDKIMTGMTRDGTFLVDDGRVVCGLRNFRFNQSVVELLRHVDSISPAVRASGEEMFDMVAPAMKVNGFHFTEVTRY